MLRELLKEGMLSLCWLPGPVLTLSKSKPTLISADHSKNHLSRAVCNQVPPPLTSSDGFYREIPVWVSLCGQRVGRSNPKLQPQPQPVMVRHSALIPSAGFQ